MSYGSGDELQKLEIALEAAGIAWWWMEIPSGAIFFSPTKARMLGYDPSNFVHYKNFTDLVHPDDYERIMQDMRDHMEGRKDVYETKYRIRCSDGTYKTFYDRGKIVARGKDGSLSIAGMVLDATSFSADVLNID